ncbi:MAG: RDD family protein [Bacteroidota bacterium]
MASKRDVAPDIRSLEARLMQPLLASRSARFWAYLIDVIPIVILLTVIAWFFFGFDETVRQYLENRNDVLARKQFLKERNGIRSFALGVWVVYGMLMDASTYQGTLGKIAMGIVVTDDHGRRISLQRSATRNFGKMLSVVPAFIGVLWIFFDPKRKALHDKLAKTLSLKRR